MAKSKRMCVGCRCDYYNRNHPGECWHYKTARVVKRVQVGTWQRPPYMWCPTQTLSCHSPDGAHWIERDDPRVVMPEKTDG